MSLSCECEFDGDDDCAYFYDHPKDYSKLETSKRKRCSSCNDLINVGATVIRFYLERPIRDDIEEKIYGEGERVPIASKYQCEKCADIWYSLYELGFTCVSPDENMLNLVKEYAETYVKLVK